MVTRLFSATPSEVLAMKPQELLDSIRMCEGRVMNVCARARGPNLVDGVTNAELAAAFGADIVTIDTYEPASPYIPGWPSKDPSDDDSTRPVQIKLGKGYTLAEIRRMIGRPVSILLVIPTAASEAGLLKHYGNIVATPKNARLAVESGADMIMLAGWAPTEISLKVLREVKAAIAGRAILEYARPHGPGLIGQGGVKSMELMTEEELTLVLKTGVDIVGLPTPGTFPGWTVEHAGRLVHIIHRHGAMASLGLHTSQEGSDASTIRRLAINAKMAGADIHEMGDSGYTESMIPPENIMTYGVAIRGRRHTYRRMAMSILR